MDAPIQMQSFGPGKAFDLGAGSILFSDWISDTKYSKGFRMPVLISFKKLREDPSEMDTVIVSHLHGDHLGSITTKQEYIPDGG
jgi:L-ascorbate metabolism protein UlaG (beta-lactamase superfamily)